MTLRKDVVWENKILRWRHCGLIGSMKMAQSNMHSIIEVGTTSLEAKALAASLLADIEVMIELLQVRIDLPAPEREKLDDPK